jgi:hypothetical protein
LLWLLWRWGYHELFALAGLETVILLMPYFNPFPYSWKCILYFFDLCSFFYLFFFCSLFF